ncbi:hypothetical protein [Methylomonas fluvii]|uniref:DUF4435 domain-containing protein n=1 Tax=Methylomonas fluvii TaxID=1854564 RepID=A0ABR9DJU9_9GAMM|nr:hypothetical protein [Methylomonas fluvii]MBD9363347.1 hypothetical protein [Methylomonas fluvii]CAD6876621.1 hypothetical protein [Methylomonas fluvii]
MILLFDITNPDRAYKAINTDIDILRWHDDGWRDINGREFTICNTDDTDANNLISAYKCWFLVHESDWASFSTCEWPDILKDRPVVRFSAGDLSAELEEGNWVRYRSVSATEPFTKEELISLENWVLKGCSNENKPWLLFDSKQLYLSGLNIILQLAQHVLSQHIIDPCPHQINNLTKQGLNVISREWWYKRLSKESDFDEKIKIEWTRRKGCSLSNSNELFLFLNWVRNEGYNYDFQSNYTKLLEEVKSAI